MVCIVFACLKLVLNIWNVDEQTVCFGGRLRQLELAILGNEVWASRYSYAIIFIVVLLFTD